MKKFLMRLKSTKGEGYVDVAVAFLAIMITFVFIITLAPVFLAKMTLNNYANELCREAEIAGCIGTETDERLDRLNEQNPNLNPTVVWSKTGRVQIGETFTVTVSADYNIDFFVFRNAPITITSTAEGTSEVFWK